MEICSEHDGEDIAHESGSCPACNHVEELENDLQEKIEEIDNLEYQIRELESQVEELKDKNATDFKNQLDSVLNKVS
jgi:TolA-binding protein